MTEGEFDAATFRGVLARYVTGVVVVSTCVEGIDHAMTANSFTSVSLDPPLVLVCVDRESRFHEAVIATDAWAVSVLGADAEPTARWFARRGRPLFGQFAHIAASRGAASGALLIDGAVAHLECRTEQLFPGGDHDILLGRVEALAVDTDSEPLVFYRHRFRGI